MKKRLQFKSTRALNYSNYLRDYYFRLASGEEKVPSNAELELFIRKLGKTPLNSKNNSDSLTEDEEVELKLIA